MKTITSFFIGIVFFANVIKAQSLTGTWEGTMAGTQFLQMNIIQVGDKLCGYTWDYEYNRRGSYCKANFDGYFSEGKNNWYITGSSLFENSGNHFLMQLKFSLEIEYGREVLRGYSRMKSTGMRVLSTSQSFVLRKVSNNPTQITMQMQECLLKETKQESSKNDTIGLHIQDSIISKSSYEIKKDTAVIVPIIPSKKDSLQIKSLPDKTNGRVNKEQSRIIINDKKIRLDIYDNGTIDGDSVSVYFDNKLVVDKKKLSGNPITLSLELDENLPLHSLVLFAENLGSIPPNTALIILTTASGKRYELSSSATLEQNAILVFEYKPK